MPVSLEISTAPRTDRNRGPQWRTLLCDAAGRPVRGSTFWACGVWEAIAAAVNFPEKFPDNFAAKSLGHSLEGAP